MKKTRLIGFTLGAIVCFAAVSVAAGFGTAKAQAAEAKTGVGLCEHVQKAKDEGWRYNYGSYGKLVKGVRYTDCSGLIKSYLWWTGENTNPNPSLCTAVAGSSESMLGSAASKGSIDLSNAASLPRVQGLILYRTNHVGVYIGDNAEIDNREEGENILKRSVIGGCYTWQKWFKLPQIQYPTSGFVTYGGNQYYYENGQYVVDTQKTVNGVVYSFNDSGKLVSGDENSSQVAVDWAMGKSNTILQFGQKSGEVLTLQKQLSALGYMKSSDCTGYFGSITKSAVLNYQKAARLPQTGVADASVLQLLNTSSVAAAS